MAANGRVLTGFSMPYVGIYSAEEGTSYSDVQVLARGVSVSVELNDTDDTVFYADNVEAERIRSNIQSGTVTLTVDGLFPTAEALILGLPTAGSDGVYHYGDNMDIPYVGIGYIERYLSDGVTTYQAVLLNKCKFSVPAENASTQTETVDFQTQELIATFSRSDNENHDWKMRSKVCATEALAITELMTMMGDE